MEEPPTAEWLSLFYAFRRAEVPSAALAVE
jgi:hypothetical protein